MYFYTVPCNTYATVKLLIFNYLVFLPLKKVPDIGQIVCLNELNKHKMIGKRWPKEAIFLA